MDFFDCTLSTNKCQKYWDLNPGTRDKVLALAPEVRKDKVIQESFEILNSFSLVFGHFFFSKHLDM